MKRFSFDLGTNSLGWAVWEVEAAENKTGTPVELLDTGVRIFNDGRDPQSRSSLAVARREARSARRQRHRSKLRKKELLRKLIANGLISKDPLQRKIVERQDPYRYRHQAASQKLEARAIKESEIVQAWEQLSGSQDTSSLDLTSYASISPAEQLGRAIFHISLRRGYKSNLKEQRDLGADTKDASTEESKETKKNLARIGKLENLLRNKKLTLGSWLYLERKGQRRFRSNSEFYASRAMYEDEFAQIRAQQEAEFGHVDWDELERHIFFQRKLQKPSRGKCSYYTDLDRAYKAQVSSSSYRIMQDLFNLKIYLHGGLEELLSHEKINAIHTKLNNAESKSFKALRKELGLPEDSRFNLESEQRKDLKGNATNVDMQKEEYFGARVWQALNLCQQDELIERLIELEYAQEEVEQAELELDLLELGVPEENIASIISYNFGSGTTMLSAELQRELIQGMRKDHKAGHKLLFEKFAKSDENSNTCDTLPYYGEVLANACYKPKSGSKIELKHGKISNPTVHIALNQLQKVVNALINYYGKPDEVVIELGRELKNSKSKREAILKEQNANKKGNDKLNEELRTKFALQHPGQRQRRKLYLYNELMQNSISAKCPYCSKTMSKNDLFSDDGSIDIEHILPFGRSLDTARSNLTIAHRACNQEKGNKTPYEAFAHDEPRWAQILDNIKHLPKAKRDRFREKAMEKYEEKDAFLSRQLTDNAYIAKKAVEYLQCISPAHKIWHSTGMITKILRDNWSLNKIISEDVAKNRDDHRHHAIDAIVVGCVDRSFLQKISRDSATDKNIFAKNFPLPACPVSWNIVAEKIEQILVSHKPDHGENNKIFAETALGKIKKAVKLPIKEAKKYNMALMVSKRLQEEFKKLILEQLEEQLAKRDISAEQAREYIEKELFQENASWDPSERVLWKKIYKAKMKDTALEAMGLKYLHFWKEYFVTTKAVTDLSTSDLEPIEKSHQGPVDEKLRQELKGFLHRQPEMDKLSKTELAGLLGEFSAKNGIKKLRYIPKDQKAVPVPGQSYKHYNNGDFAYATIWRCPDPKGYKYKGVFVSRFEQMQGLKIQRPHPAAKKLMQLYKQDTIRVTKKEGQVSYYRIAGFSTSNDKLDIKKLNDAQSGQHHKSINKIFADTVEKVQIGAAGRLA